MSRTPRWLVLFPRRFRRDFADDLRALYDRLDAERPANRIGRWIELLRLAAGARWDDLKLRRRRRTQRRPTTRSEAPMLDALGHDLRFAVRTLVRSPAVSVLAVLTLALGVGGTTALFSAIDDVLFHPLSAPEPERIVQLYDQAPSGRFLLLSYEDVRDVGDQARSLEAVGVFRSQSVAVTGGDAPPERIRGLFVDAPFFRVIGEQPTLGRGIAPGEDAPGEPRTAVLSAGFWHRRFGGDPTALGRTILLNNEPHTVVGVMPEDLRLPIDATEAWISLHTYPGTLSRENRNVSALARLAPGVGIDQALQEVALIGQRLSEAHGTRGPGVQAGVVRFTEVLIGDLSRQLFTILFAAVALVLLIGAVNVANLQLVRMAGRGRELAMRHAVGSRRLRLLGQLLTESLVLALLAGAVGIAVAGGVLRLLSAIGPGWLFGRYPIDLDWRALGFALAVTLIAGLACGLVPALRASRTDLVDGLRDGGRGSDRSSGRLRAALVVAQLAMAVMLVIGAGLLIRSFANLTEIDVGFDRDNLLTVQFRLPANKYQTDEQVVAFFDRTLERVAEVPGALGVASAQGMPFAGDEGRVPFLADGVDPGADVDVPMIAVNTVTPGYFEVLGIPLVAGRSFDTSDRQDSALVAVISARAAAEAWPGEDAVGRTFGVRGDPRLFTVIGVVGDVYSRGLRSGSNPMIYASQRQLPSRFATLAVRVPAEPLAYADAVRAAIWELDPDQPVWEVMSQNQRIASWIGTERSAASLVSWFALVALALSAIGIAGVIAFSVIRRTRELGIRMALGARRQVVVGMIMRQGLRLIVFGMTFGIGGALALRQLLTGWLYGIDGIDVASFAVAPLGLTAVALAAAFVPALRAARVDPIVALRED